MKGEINSNTIIVGDFNTPLTPMVRSTKQKVNEEAQALNDTMDQLDLTVVCIFSDHNAVRLDINHRGEKTIKNTNIWRLNNTFLNSPQIMEEIKICIEANENENTTTQNLWDSVKAVRRFIAIHAYLKKQEKNK